MKPLKALFLDHPAAVDETYFGHMAFALRFFALLLLAAGAALIHAIFPFLCERTASTIIKTLYEKTHARMPAETRPTHV